jgi:hypothetical protein
MGRLLYGVDKLVSVVIQSRSTTLNVCLVDQQEFQEYHQDAVPLDPLSGSLASGEVYLLGLL